MEKAPVFEGSIEEENQQYLFYDKSIVAVSIDNAFMTIDTIYTECEVYPPERFLVQVRLCNAFLDAFIAYAIVVL
jgi:hypothetical protein